MFSSRCWERRGVLLVEQYHLRRESLSHSLCLHWDERRLPFPIASWTWEDEAEVEIASDVCDRYEVVTLIDSRHSPIMVQELHVPGERPLVLRGTHGECVMGFALRMRRPKQRCLLMMAIVPLSLWCDARSPMPNAGDRRSAVPAPVRPPQPTLEASRRVA